MSKTIIKVENLSKRYRIGLQEKKADTFAQQLWNNFKAPVENFKRIKSLGKFQEENESVHWALRDVSFEVKQGEVLGIIGKNGAGKSTLLKILSKITEPTSGRIEMNGRVAALLEVGTGFHPELTGRENIYMNGTILGMTKKEIDHKLDEIIDFSGVEKYIDTPVKFYSSGMRVRLGFSVAAHLEPEILIIDEVLAVGDAEFQKKCLGKMKDVSQNEGRTILFVSHDMNAVYKLTSKSMLLDQGKISAIGTTEDIIRKYRTEVTQIQNQYFNPDQSNGVTFIEVITSTGTGIHEFGKPLKINLKAKFTSDFKNVALAFQFIDEFGHSVINPLVTQDKINWVNNGIGEIKLIIPYPRFILGKYSMTVHMGDKAGKQHIQTLENACSFEVAMDHLHSDYGWNRSAAFYLESHIWETENLKYESVY
ncbi:ABC transporter ATP-binding protein [Arthrospiribacter ruber]|uniref:ABC transporter ATP-binding protein n=1 Tax=Arthrospiribacter ruber TaxID=2487934 RepID=A0A951MB16_9BACT|nr:ABC transporter ATP-binding protein [Arthrospiribacter ruber]MBW3466587.1 ABC transporter ATP-binding protein [Arthrospiribacter ruber]